MFCYLLTISLDRKKGVRLPLRVKVLLLFVAWLAAEMTLLSVLMHLMGWLPVFLLGIATTLLGVSQIRRVGKSAFENLRTGVQAGEPGMGDFVGGSVRAIGALLLIIPGFLTDAIGALLLLPPVRRFAQTMIRPIAPMRTGTVDLDETEWRRTEPDPPGRISPHRPTN